MDPNRKRVCANIDIISEKALCYSNENPSNILHDLLIFKPQNSFNIRNQYPPEPPTAKN